ncbi:hypothetical protein BHM03_00019681 [Ensete ventricosum]|nr:hypothetical protein BHM03_00019681 [Ensete ventricosum]
MTRYDGSLNRKYKSLPKGTAKEGSLTLFLRLYFRPSRTLQEPSNKSISRLDVPLLSFLVFYQLTFSFVSPPPPATRAPPSSNTILRSSPTQAVVLFCLLRYRWHRAVMARNEEKAQSMLNRWVDMKNEERKKPKERRPYLASECRDLADAHKWRSEILREIGVKVTEIQNEGLGEHRLRDLNDEINKLLRERVHWERRIVDLGGPNYTKHAAKMTDLEGNIIDVPNPSGRGPGYRYFGAAKKLPGVRELFEKPPEVKKRRTRYEIYKRIDASYYGYRDDEDGILEKLEAPAQDDMRRRAVEELERIKAIRSEAMKLVKSGEVASVEPTAAPAVDVVLFEGVEDVVEEERRLEMEKEELERSKVQQEFVAHVPLPDDKEIERMVVEKKKKELLSKYMSEELMEEEQEAKEMLNVNR